MDNVSDESKSQLNNIINKVIVKTPEGKIDMNAYFPANVSEEDLIQEAKKYDNKDKFLMSQGALTTDTTYATKKRLLAKADKTNDMGE
jgi:hypothetical protein